MKNFHKNTGNFKILLRLASAMQMLLLRVYLCIGYNKKRFIQKQPLYVHLYFSLQRRFKALLNLWKIYFAEYLPSYRYQRRGI